MSEVRTGRPRLAPGPGPRRCEPVAPIASVLLHLGVFAGLAVLAGPGRVPAVREPLAVTIRLQTPMQPPAAATAMPAARRALSADGQPSGTRSDDAHTVEANSVEAEAAKTRSVLAALAARIRAAVRQATVYPLAARSMGLSGRAQIRFTYNDGVASGVRVVQSAHAAVLDRAAVEAVERAVMPPEPRELADQSLTLAVWVDFPGR